MLFVEPAALAPWLARWRARCAAEDDGSESGPARAARMRRVNRRLIPRNHRVEEALAAASEEGDLAPFTRLLTAVRHPYDEDPDYAPYAEPAPAEFMAQFRTFCGT